MIKKTRLQIVLMIIAMVILSFAFIVYTLLPQLSDFRNSIYGLLINNSILVVLLLTLTLNKKINMPWIGKITVWAFGLLYILFQFINLGRIEAVFFFIYSIVNIIVSIYVYKKKGIAYKSIWGFGVFAYLTTIVFDLKVGYINGEMNSTFLLPSVIVSIIAFVPCLIYGLIMFTVNKDIEKLICAPLLGILGGFILTYLTVSSMNVYLDSSEPVYQEYIIVNKDIDAGARRITTYEFEVQKDDVTFTIGVSEAIYYDYEVNDSIVLAIYSGAFNEPYLIHDMNRE